jgi:hypothetical protein
MLQVDSTPCCLVNHAATSNKSSSSSSNSSPPRRRSAKNRYGPTSLMLQVDSTPSCVALSIMLREYQKSMAPGGMVVVGGRVRERESEKREEGGNGPYDADSKALQVQLQTSRQRHGQRDRQTGRQPGRQTEKTPTYQYCQGRRRSMRCRSQSPASSAAAGRLVRSSQR